MFKTKLFHVAISILVGCLVINTSLSPTFAQSTDRDKATPLITNIISGKGLQDRDQVFYYRFTAKPGKMAITIDVDQFGNGSIVTAALQTPDGENIVEVSGSPNYTRKVERFEFKKETPVVLLLTVTSGGLTDYSYSLKLDGDWKELIRL